MEQPVFERPLIYALGPYHLDAQRLLLLLDGEPIALGPKVVETLLALVERPGEVLTKDELLERIWPEGYVEEANLAQNIYVLRKTLGIHWNIKPIETIPRRGYRLVADVAQVALPPSERPVLQIVSTHAPMPQTRVQSQMRRWPWVAVVAAAAILLGLSSAANRAATPSKAVLSAQGAQQYALGRYYWNLRTAQSLAKSVQYFKEVVKHDPKNATGYAALGDAYAMIVDYGCKNHACKQTIGLAKHYAHVALQIDPASAEAHTTYAMTLEMFDNAYEAADAEFAKAIALDPKYALAHEWYATSLLMHGRIASARRELEAAVTLEPVATATNAWLGIQSYFDHRYAASVSYNHQALDLNPNRLEAVLLMGLSQEQLGDRRGALESFRKFSQVCKCPAQGQVLVAGLYAHDGQRAEAIAALNRALGMTHDLPMDEVALVFVALGDHDRALSYMRRVHFKDRSERMFLALDPRLDPVRRDARFRTWTSAG
ncbi:MAG: hypothetical protein NVSMB31_00360 [Vulcanimicrobiaceae bacterium]